MKEKYRCWNSRIGELTEIGVNHTNKTICNKSYGVGSADIIVLLPTKNL